MKKLQCLHFLVILILYLFQIWPIRATANRDKLLVLSVVNDTVIVDIQNRECRSLAIGQMDLIEYDSKRNCLFYYQNDMDYIALTCFSDYLAGTVLVRVEMNTVRSMAFVPAFESLYFFDVKNLAFKVIDSVYTHRSEETILSIKSDLRPTKMVVEPKMRYLFWTVKSRAIIARVNLDGTNLQHIVTGPQVKAPAAIAIEHDTDRIYWSDIQLNHIGRCDFDGNHYEIVIQDNNCIDHTTLLVFGENYLYWDSLKMGKDQIIYGANAANGKNINVVEGDVKYLRDMKFIGNTTMDMIKNCCGLAQCAHSHRDSNDDDDHHTHNHLALYLFYGFVIVILSYLIARYGCRLCSNHRNVLGQRTTTG